MPLADAQPGLLARVDAALQFRIDRKSEPRADQPREHLRLIKAARPLTVIVQRHRHETIVVLGTNCLQHRLHQLNQIIGAAIDAFVFERADQSADGRTVIEREITLRYAVRAPMPAISRVRLRMELFAAIAAQPVRVARAGQIAAAQTARPRRIEQLGQFVPELHTGIISFASIRRRLRAL